MMRDSGEEEERETFALLWGAFCDESDEWHAPRSVSVFV